MRIIDLSIPSHRPFLDTLREYAEGYCRRMHKRNGSIEILLAEDEWKKLKDEAMPTGPWYTFNIDRSNKFFDRANVQVRVRQDYD